MMDACTGWPMAGNSGGSKVLVLRSDIQGDGQLGQHGYQRFVRVVRLWRQRVIASMVISGEGGQPRPVTKTMGNL
jgi:hypothetical protein